MLRPSTLTTTGSPTLRPRPSAIFFSNDTSGGPLVSAPHHSPSTTVEPRGTSVAKVMPRSLCSTQDAFGCALMSSALMPFADMMRPRSIGTRSRLRVRRVLAHEGVEAVGVGRLDVDEIERRRLVGQRAFELPPQIAVDLDHGDEQREAEPERQHDGRRQRARPVDVGDGEAQRRRLGVRQPPGDRHQQRSRRAAAAANTAAAAATKISAILRS